MDDVWNDYWDNHWHFTDSFACGAYLTIVKDLILINNGSNLMVHDKLTHAHI